MTQFDRDMLHAYVDNQLDPARKQAVEALLRSSPDTAAEFADYVTQRDGLQELYNPVLIEPLPLRLTTHRLETAHLHRSLREFTIAASLMMVLFVGGTLALYFRSSDPASYSDIITSAFQSHLSPEPVSEKSLTASEISALFGTRIAVPDLSAEGLAFQSALDLGTQEEPRVALLYASTSGASTTLYLAEVPKPGSPTLHAVQSGNLHALYWANDVISCTIVSATADLKAISEKAFAQLTPGEANSQRAYRDI